VAASAEPHRWPVRVYYEDTDAGGNVYHASYLRFAERARTEMLRTLGQDHRSLLERYGVVFVVRRCTADFRRAARLDDRLEVVTRLERVRGASLDLLQEVRRAHELVAGLEIRLALLDRRERATRLPRELLKALEPLHGDQADRP
jgi:acyl-CoA thioester hydrolase